MYENVHIQTLDNRHQLKGETKQGLTSDIKYSLVLGNKLKKKHEKPLKQ